MSRSFDKYALLDAARTFLAILREADQAAIDLAYQRLATEANDSDFAADYEPKQGLCLAIQAELRRQGQSSHEAVSR
jgi:hypothetical protein